MSSAPEQKKSKSTKKKKGSNGTPKKKKPEPQEPPVPSTNPMIPSEQGLFSAIEDSMAEMVEQDVVVQWFSSLLSPEKVKMIESDPASSDAAAGRLPIEVVPATENGKMTSKLMVARISQNERWSMWGKWGAESLLPTDPAPFSTVDLKVTLPLEGINPEALADGPKAKVWAAPVGYEWAPGGGWALDVDASALREGGTVEDDQHDANRWTYAVGTWFLESNGSASDGGAFVRRRIWERRIVIEGSSSGAKSSTLYYAAGGGARVGGSSDGASVRGPGESVRPNGGGGGGGVAKKRSVYFGDEGGKPAPGLSRFHVDLSTGAGLGLSPSLVVTRVVEGGPAQQRGLTLGCKVVQVAGGAVADLHAFKAAFQKCRERGDTTCSIDFKSAADVAAEAAAETSKQQEAEEAAAAAALAAEDAKVAMALKSAAAGEPADDFSGTKGGWEMKENDVAGEEVEVEEEDEAATSPRVMASKTKKKSSFRRALSATGFGKKKSKGK